MSKHIEKYFELEKKLRDISEDMMYTAQCFLTTGNKEHYKYLSDTATKIFMIQEEFRNTQCDESKERLKKFQEDLAETIKSIIK